MNYVPECGDIVWLSGGEETPRRHAFVITKKAFNQHTGLALVAPVSEKIRHTQLEVALDDQSTIGGAILVYQFKAVDFNKCEATFIEKASPTIIERVKIVLRVIMMD
jgi:mRNA-degrading endonuclease toxin of MazEF toxin-antitoxin module